MRVIRNTLLLVLVMVLLLPATASAKDLTAEMHHLMLRLAGDGLLLVREQIVLKNSGPDAAEEAFSIALPEGYQDLEYLKGIDAAKAKVENGLLVVGEPVKPGQTTYQLQYLVPQGEAPHFLLKKKLTAATKAFYVMTEKGVLEVFSDKLKDAGPIAMGEVELQLYEASNLESGSTVEIAVQKAAGPKDGQAGSSAVESAGVQDEALARFMNQLPFKGVTAVLFLALVLILPVLGISHYLARRKGSSESKAVAEEEEEAFRRLVAKEKHLKSKLVELEKNYADQKIDDSEYEAMREVYKKKLLEVRAELKSYTE